MDNHNFDGQALLFKSDLETEQFLSDDQLPLECTTNICAVSSYLELQNLIIDDTHLPALPSSVTAVGPACPIGHLPLAHGSLQSPTTTGSVDCSVASSPGPCQSQWSEMNASLTHETRASVPYPENQHQVQPKILCGWSPDLEFPVPHSILQSLPQMDTHSNPDAEQYDPWSRYFLGGTADAYSLSPNGDTALPASGFLGAPADCNFPFGARADPQPSISLMHNAMSSIQSTGFPYSEPICVPDGRTRTSECRWLTNGALCGVYVMADRRSVFKHLQGVHDIRPGEDKARQTCLWESCTTTLNKESLVRHILTVHLKEGVGCAQCGLSFAREDSLKRHLKKGQHRVSSDKSAARQPVRNHARSRRPEH